jgi:integrase
MAGGRRALHTVGRPPPRPARRLGGVQGLLEEAGITDRRLYDGSRHTAGTILNELGVDMPTIMEILRHTQISQTRRYVKGRSHLSKDAMRRMGDHFMPSEPAPEPATETVDRRARRRRRIQ